MSELPAAIPTDMDLADADIEVLNAPDSPATELWDFIRGSDTANGVSASVEVTFLEGVPI